MMDTYRREVAGRVRWMLAGSALLVAAVAVALWMAWQRRDGTHMEGFTMGVQTGLFVAGLALMLRALVTYRRALRDADALQRLHIAETDERRRFIQDKIGGVGLNIAIGLLMAGTIIAGFFDQTVFLTLLAAVAAVVFVKAGLKCYFARQY